MASNTGGESNRQTNPVDTKIQNSDETPENKRQTSLEEGNTSNTKCKVGNCPPNCLTSALVLVLYSPLKFYPSCKVYVSLINLTWFSITLGKIGLLTAFTFDIGSARSELGVVVTSGYISLQHLLLKDWDAGFETVPYPPAHGEFAVYTIEDLEEALNFAVEQYYNVEEKATGYFVHTTTDNIDINIKYFNWTKDATTGRYSGLVIEEKSFKPDRGLSNYTEGGLTLYKYNITADLQTSYPSILQTVLTVRMNLSLHSVRVFDDSGAICLLIQANVTFQDNDHNGQVIANLTTLTTVIECTSIGYDIADKGSKKLCEKCTFFWTLLLVAVSGFFNGTATTVWIIFALNRICKICKRCKDVRDVDNVWGDILSGLFESGVSFAGDIIAFIAILDIQTEHNHLTTLRNMDRSTVILGCGLVLSYISLLRFVKINKKFSILFKTLRKASGAIISFLICVAIMFAGFLCFGYIVLGTYHVKFRDIPTTADTLFSIIYGDEIFATLAISQNEYAGDIELINYMVHVFVYTYVLIFTLLVFNLLIALFNSAYDEVKESFKKEARETKEVSSLVNVIPKPENPEEPTCSCFDQRDQRNQHDQHDQLDRNDQTCIKCFCGL